MRQLGFFAKRFSTKSGRELNTTRTSAATLVLFRKKSVIAGLLTRFSSEDFICYCRPRTTA